MKLITETQKRDPNQGLKQGRGHIKDFANTVVIDATLPIAVVTV